MAEGVPHELIGGLAVLVHVEEANPEPANLSSPLASFARQERD